MTPNLLFKTHVSIQIFWTSFLRKIRINVKADI